MGTTPNLRWLCTLAGAGCMTACSTISAPPPLSHESEVRPAATEPRPSGADPYIVFNRTLRNAQSVGASSADQLNLLSQGFALVNYRCNQYFSVLGAAEQDLRFTRKQTSLTSGVVLAALGLANATTKTVANVGSLFSFGVASMDSYQDVYIFSPDVKAVQRLVLDALSTYREKFVRENGDTPAMSYTAVISTLSEYEAFCQPHGVRDLVNQSLAQTTTSAEPRTPAPAAGIPPPAFPAAGMPPGGMAGGAGSPKLNVLPRIDVRVVPK